MWCKIRALAKVSGDLVSIREVRWQKSERLSGDQRVVGWREQRGSKARLRVAGWRRPRGALAMLERCAGKNAALSSLSHRFSRI